MGTNTGIEYVNHSLNFWMGCTAVRPELGCKNCYAQQGMKRYGKDPHKVVRTSRATWRQPLVKTQGEYKWKSGDYIFVCSWSDFFHPDADEWRTEAWDLMRKRPDLIWVIVTKRIEQAIYWIPLNWEWRNRIIVATVENQEIADRDIPKLLALRNQFDNLILSVSVEPMLEAIDLHLTHSRKDILWRRTHGGSYEREFLHQIIIGAESIGGRPGRECKLEWVRDLVAQCKTASVPVFIKQLHINGKLVKDITKFPNDLQIRKYPKGGAK